tara:strand:- start:1049 stop:1315 length:267 start_codon:yes stop_codon:yes gene_type:complete
MAADKVNHPDHYKGKKGYEVIDIVEFFDLNFHRGNVIKYVLRAGRKNEKGYEDLAKEIEDLEKAGWYLMREVKKLREEIADANVESTT